MAIKPRFEDCIECRFFKRNTIVPQCLKCTAGEFFEEKFSEFDPDALEYRKFSKVRDDE